MGNILDIIRKLYNACVEDIVYSNSTVYIYLWSINRL